jgi:hypothetical protein
MCSFEHTQGFVEHNTVGGQNVSSASLKVAIDEETILVVSCFKFVAISVIDALQVHALFVRANFELELSANNATFDVKVTPVDGAFNVYKLFLVPCNIFDVAPVDEAFNVILCHPRWRLT